MSHFTVTVCLPEPADGVKLEDCLNEILEPWNEGREVEPYKSFEEGSPEDHWFVSSARRNAEHHRNGTGIKPHNPDMMASFSTGESRQTPDEQRAEFAAWVEWDARLGDHPTWELVVELHNAKYCPPNALAVVGEVGGDEPMLYDEETARPFTWSTYNPDSKWDWWCIGGRWRNSLHAKQGVDASALVVTDRHWTEDYRQPGDEVEVWAPNNGRRCDGGPKGLLDFESMRDQAEARAVKQIDAWDAICARTPHADPWQHFAGLAQLGEITRDQARARYHSQPRIEALGKDEELKYLDDPIERFLPGREEYLAMARRGAVPGYALITLDREWVAPGRMGWFGVSSCEPGTRDAYKIAANAYLESLADDILIVQIDCHI